MNSKMKSEENTELSNTYGNANQTNNKDYSTNEILDIKVKDAEFVKKMKNGEELVKREMVEGTPFVIISQEKSHIVTIGQYKLEEYQNIEQAREDANRFDWERIMQVVDIMINYNLNLKK